MYTAKCNDHWLLTPPRPDNGYRDGLVSPLAGWYSKEPTRRSSIIRWWLSHGRLYRLVLRELDGNMGGNRVDILRHDVASYRQVAGPMILNSPPRVSALTFKLHILSGYHELSVPAIIVGHLGDPLTVLQG